MRVRWLKSHLLGAGKTAKAGDVSEELHPLEAQRKISMGYAEPVGAAAERPSPPADVAGHEQPGNRDPKPSARGAGKE